MSREQLIEMARHNIAHVKADTIEQAEEIGRVPAWHYYDPDRWSLEIERVFKRLPLMLATTAELSKPGDYKACSAVGVPVLISRGEDGQVRAFVNSCSHRGAQIMLDGCGNTHRFTCPYHAWNYNQQGELTGIYARKDFGELDAASNGLVPLPVAERAGLIWVTVNPDSKLDIDHYLCGYDALLEHFGMRDWYFHDRRVLKGPNWKIAYDGYLDLYHLPILHRETFGPQWPNRALYYGFGPHQRACFPEPDLVELEASTPEKEWPVPKMLNGVWTIFPHVSMASFDGGGRGVMVSQLFPGDTPGESYTVQNYLMEKEPDEEHREQAREQFELLRYVVQEEDYATGLRQQKALETGLKEHVLFGRNEAGGQNFHRWLDTLLHTEDADLSQLFD